MHVLQVVSGMETMGVLDDGKWQEFDNFKDHYPPEFYAALLDKLNSKDVKVRSVHSLIHDPTHTHHPPLSRTLPLPRALPV